VPYCTEKNKPKTAEEAIQRVAEHPEISWEITFLL
jgi:hypothetical protein